MFFASNVSKCIHRDMPQTAAENVAACGKWGAKIYGCSLTVIILYRRLSCKDSTYFCNYQIYI